MADIFLSYSRKDNDFMPRTRDYLSAAGLSVWTDENLTPGTPAWTRAIEKAIREAKLFVIILSPDAKNSDWVERELAVAQDSCRIPIFPILVRGDEHTAIPLRLAATQFADARRDPDRALARLTKSVNNYLSGTITDTQPIYIAPFITAAKNVVVAKTGDADYRTIGEAVKEVAENTIIIVREGLYQESITLSKSVIIKGEGKREAIILESNKSSCVKMAADHAEIQGITIRLRVNNSLAKHHAVDIPQGKLILENCEITSDSLSCVAIHGKGANPILRKCVIHDSKQCGILIYEQGTGLIENCDIYSHTATAIEIREDANPTFRRCKIHHSKAGGVLVRDNGTGTFEDCDIFSNATHGFIIRVGGNPTVRRCTISRNAFYGIYVHDKGRGVFENCDLRGNAGKPWMISDWCVVRKRDNTE